MNELDVIKTSDFTLASTLYCLGNDVIGIDRDNPRRAIFYFRKEKVIESLITEYFANRIKVNPLEFARAQRELRAQMHTET